MLEFRDPTQGGGVWKLAVLQTRRVSQVGACIPKCVFIFPNMNGLGHHVDEAVFWLCSTAFIVYGFVVPTCACDTCRFFMFVWRSCHVSFFVDLVGTGPGKSLWYV